MLKFLAESIAISWLCSPDSMMNMPLHSLRKLPKTALHIHLHPNRMFHDIAVKNPERLTPRLSREGHHTAVVKICVAAEGVVGVVEI